jgi:hypothetical protein
VKGFVYQAWFTLETILIAYERFAVRVGLDFDNTLAEYDQLFTALAVETGLFEVAPAGGKRQIRDDLRHRPNGELDWRRLQAMAYGSRLEEANLFDGAANFLKACKSKGIEIHIVSHKTRYPACREIRIDMREAALNWMQRRGFFAANDFDLNQDHVHFADSRSEKVQKIADLRCDVFVDDLEEVFIEAGFPVNTRKILFAPDQVQTDIPVQICHHWKEIADVVIGQPAYA